MRCVPLLSGGTLQLGLGNGGNIDTRSTSRLAADLSFYSASTHKTMGKEMLVLQAYRKRYEKLRVWFRGRHRACLPKTWFDLSIGRCQGYEKHPKRWMKVPACTWKSLPESAAMLWMPLTNESLDKCKQECLILCVCCTHTADKTVCAPNANKSWLHRHVSII